MMVSDEKLALAVLLKLHQFANEDGDLLWVSRLKQMFSVAVPLWRLEILLESLRRFGWAEPALFADKVVWKITADGDRQVRECLQSPTTFIFRLKEHGDGWLATPEASDAKLGATLKIPIAEQGFSPKAEQKISSFLRWDLHKPENRLALGALIVTIAGVAVAIWLDYN